MKIDKAIAALRHAVGNDIAEKAMLFGVEGNRNWKTDEADISGTDLKRIIQADRASAKGEDSARHVELRSAPDAKYSKIESITRVICNAISSAYRDSQATKRLFKEDAYSGSSAEVFNYQKISVPEAGVSIVSASVKVKLPMVSNDYDEHHQAIATIGDTSDRLVSRVADKLLDKNVYLIKGVVALQYCNYAYDIFKDRSQMNLSFVYIEGMAERS